MVNAEVRPVCANCRKFSCEGCFNSKLAYTLSRESNLAFQSATFASLSASSENSSSQARSAFRSINSAVGSASILGNGFDALLVASIEADMRWLKRRRYSKQLIDQPLWLDDLGFDENLRINCPASVRELLDPFATSPLVQKGNWGIWVNWYLALLTGGSPSVLGGADAIHLTQFASGFWQRDPDRVVADIAELIGWRSRKLVDDEQKTMKAFIVDLLERENRHFSIDEIDQAFYEEGYDLSRPSVRGRLNSLTAEGRIRRTGRAIYSSLESDAIEFPGDDSAQDTQLDVVPSQGPGPHFRTNADGLLDRAPPSEIDGIGNDAVTVNQLKPLVQKCASDLQTLLSRNEFPELLDATQRYISALNPNDDKAVEWGEVWGLGAILQNAASAAQRAILTRTLPELEDPAKTALDSLLRLHGPMILATSDGARLSEIASTFSMTRDEQGALRVSAQGIAHELAASPSIITPTAVESVSEAADAIGNDPHPERGTVYGLATIKNISVVLVGSAAVASPAIIAALVDPALGVAASAPSFFVIEAVKKSPAFTALVTQFGAKLDAMTDIDFRSWFSEKATQLSPFRSFVIKNETHLRRIAEATPELAWMLRYIDFITKDKAC